MPVQRLRQLSFLGILGLAAAGCATERPDSIVDPSPPQPRPETVRARTFDRILELEDRRTTGRSELQRLALSNDPRVRARATRALGRLPYPAHGAEVSTALEGSLEDPDPRVRSLAAFGLGLRADPATAQALLAAWKDPDPTVRARIVEAGSRYEDPAVREEVLYSLSDPSLPVRTEAALAPHRWDPEASTATLIDIALRNVAAKAPLSLREERWGEAAGDGAGPVEDTVVIAAALFSLQRRKSQQGEGVFRLWCRYPEDVMVRLWATRGLAALPESTELATEALRACLADEDWRVVVEAAVGLGRFPEPASVPPLGAALQHPSALVRTTVASTLGSFEDQRLQARPLLERCLVDVSPNVRARAIHSLAKLFGEEVAADLQARGLDTEPMVRKAVAQSCQFLSTDAGLPLLIRLSRDKDMAVAFAAAAGLGPFLDAGGRVRAHELLVSDDNGLRLGAVLSLKEGPITSDLHPLMQCYKTSTGDIADEIRYEILNIAAELSDDRAFEILSEGLRSHSAYVRNLAREHLAQRFPHATLRESSPLPPLRGALPPEDPDAVSPRVELRTSRGTLVFELYPREAPIHVHNFLTLARRDAYDGLRFHRVVADFVAQGGDYRGDGNGGETWRVEPLRHEFNERKYVEGSLGMPRNSDPDSGGSQIFITHRPTPHLDGRYTLFGQLVQGFDVLRQLEEGDRILDVAVRGE